MTAGYSVAFPFLAIYLSSKRGVPMGTVGAFLSFSMLVGAASQVVGGEISDAIGRRKVMVGALAFRSLLICVIAWAIYAEAPLWAIYVFHPLGMLIGSFIHPAARSWVADHTPPSARMRAYGFLRMVNNAGWAAGPAVGGLLAAYSYSRLFFLTAFVYAACAVIIYAYIRDKAGAASGSMERFSLAAAAHTLSDRAFRRFCVFGFTMASVMSQLVVSTSLYSKTYLGFSERQIGLLFTLNGVVVVLVQYFATRLLERWRITTGLTLGAFCYALGYLGVGYAPGYYFAAAAITLVTLGEVAVSPGLQALGANMAPPNEKGRYLGVQGLFQHVGSAAGIYMGSHAIESISPRFQQGPWFLVAFMACVSAAGFWSLGGFLSREKNGMRQPDPVPAPPPPAD